MSLVNQEQFDQLLRRVNSLENSIGGVVNNIGAVARQELMANSTVIEQAQAQFGLYTALCVETIDVWKQNKIRFFSPLFHDPTLEIEKLPWANPVSSLGGFDDCGLTWVPPAGSTVCILFENGNRDAPYYIGTTWHRDRGPDGYFGHNWGYNIEEYYKIWAGRRGGYLVGPDDGSQVLPPWNTENYSGFDLSSGVDFSATPEAQNLLTYPNIFGMKTPEKHYIKMVDGDPKCNRKWKRFEIMSSCGNWIMLKDDHLHYAGQWANPQCGRGVKEGDTYCAEEGSQNQPYPEPGASVEGDAECDGKTTNAKIIGGHPDTGYGGSSFLDSREKTEAKYYREQRGSNPFFKQSQECRPYKGPPTPENPLCDLPQTGIQIMSISGHTLVFDDSVEEPSGVPNWDRDFDFGCNDHYVGRTYWKSATGHVIELSDIESPQGDQGSVLRGKENGIKLLTATGNKIELNDHTESQVGQPCPPNIAGSERGIHIQSTSNHTFDMVDEANEQCGPSRMSGGIPVAKAKKAFVKIRTGYGLELMMADSNSQESTQQQYISLIAPQKDNIERGQHSLTMQEAPTGPGQVFLRVGGNYIINTYDQHTTIVGDFENNPANLSEYVSKSNYVYTKDAYINVSDRLHLFQARDNIFLLAGQDCNQPPADCGGCGGDQPCIGGVLVFDFCKGCVRISDRVFASTSSRASQLSIFQLLPFRKVPPC